MTLYFVESYGDEYPTLHGVYTSRDLAELAKERFGAEEIREEQADVMPELPTDQYAYRVTWDGTNLPFVERHPDPWAVWRQPRAWHTDGVTTWIGFAKGGSEAAEKAKAATPLLIQQEQEMSLWRDASNKALQHAFTTTITRADMWSDRITEITDFKFNYNTVINHE